MARTELTITPVPRAGLSLAAALPNAANADGHMFTWSDKRQIRIKNTNASSRTITFQIPGEVDGQPLPDRAYVIPASTGDVLIPPLPAVYRRSDGMVWLDYTATADVTVAVYELP
ncbi:hypothetical protein [Spongiactinospora sp. TRM90649]|uniref:hypothetical protein n=1 Tax=Spongiactinospora sp. TRM90649 TaxID=3031114 RepID=UPI0023FA007F|nr:hypothetical protein [Spongiactinospora sp. TRM90649]MDF5756655.1 hypothetical protein [Spongiactinospora sp. TRM90649]